MPRKIRNWLRSEQAGEISITIMTSTDKCITGHNKNISIGTEQNDTDEGVKPEIVTNDWLSSLIDDMKMSEGVNNANVAYELVIYQH